ncbi:hypothetical protein [Streptomyces sp. DSM 40750]|uniref:hypothetical protein n=1 Tax=Streptomyces sp. DSM 40750 TaxID=2801030 RepID=UPI00214B595A|nr:hypothetical protein [Streptomyces sp. DSM 40750]UUU22209.1 hypothetical protein JIX55_18890 [Streptomyces sp. DSM 40750]
MREGIGDVMNKLKKTAALVAVVGGLGLVGSGVASANGGPFPVAENLQVVGCEQTFAGGTGSAASPVDIGGEAESRIGSSCFTAVDAED